MFLKVRVGEEKRWAEECGGRERRVLGKGRVLLWNPCRKDQVESRAGVSREE